jgi:hypothetical protein
VSSFVDKMRRTPTTTRPLTVHGFDPDGDTTGWARISATIEKPAAGPPRVAEVHLGLIEPPSGRHRDLEQAEAMVRAVFEHQCVIDGVDPHVFVEAQRVYPEEDEEPQTRIAKANDLLRLAQVTGAVQALAHAQSAFVRAVLPQTWKGNQRKEHTIASCQQRLTGIKILLMRRGKPPEQVDALRLDKLPGRLGHALDALGIAFYGLDWISRHEVHAP